mmetsp:Transcript_262/g.447  ORF Transcript_262/g.447 Transcript_262/m.447 type:complete len:91 (+) Transcript_262:142-414(+)
MAILSPHQGVFSQWAVRAGTPPQFGTQHNPTQTSCLDFHAVSPSLASCFLSVIVNITLPYFKAVPLGACQSFKGQQSFGQTWPPGFEIVA